MVYRILVASYTNEIYTLVFDPDATSLELVSTITVGHHPSWLTPHPKDKSIVYTGLEQSDGKIVALKYDEEGRGTVIGEIPSEGADPCALLALEDELIIGNVRFGAILYAAPTLADPSHSIVLIRTIRRGSVLSRTSLYSRTPSLGPSVYRNRAQQRQARSPASSPGHPTPRTGRGFGS